MYPIGIEVDIKFSTDIYRIALGHSLVRNDEAEFGVSAGPVSLQDSTDAFR